MGSCIKTHFCTTGSNLDHVPSVSSIWGWEEITQCQKTNVYMPKQFVSPWQPTSLHMTRPLNYYFCRKMMFIMLAC